MEKKEITYKDCWSVIAPLISKLTETDEGTKIYVMTFSALHDAHRKDKGDSK